MKFLNSIGAAFRAKPVPDSAQIRELLAKTETETEAARTRLAALESQRSEKVLTGEKERAVYRTDLVTTRDDVADGEAAIEGLRSRLDAAIASEAEAGRRSRYDTARATASALEGLVADYARHADAIRETVRKITEIDSAVVKANADLPAGERVLPTSGALRSVPSKPREVISEKQVELWCREGSPEPVSDAVQDSVAPMADGRGFHHPPGHRSPMYLNKRRFIRREFREAVNHVHAPAFDKIVLPDARAAAASNNRPVQVEFKLVKDEA